MWRRNIFTFTRFRGSSADAHPCIIIVFISSRDIWVLLFLACVTLCDAVKVKVLKTKAVGDSGTTFLLKGRCAIKVSEAIPSAQLNIQFDKDTFEFEVRSTCTYIWIWGKKYNYWAAARLIKSKPRHEISNNVVCATSKASDQPAHTRRLIRAFASRLGMLWLLSYWLNTILSF